jgi:hypothetical protein
MELVISGRELDELLRTTVGWIRAEITTAGVVLRFQKGPFWKKITVRRIAVEEQVIAIDYDSMLVDVAKALVDMFKALPPVRDWMKGVPIRMEGRRVYLNFTKPLLAKAQVNKVDATFKPNQLRLGVRLVPLRAISLP